MKRSSEFLLLEKLLEKNRRLFRKDIIEAEEYIDNHDMIMEKLKNSIFKIESSSLKILYGLDIDDSIERYRNEMFIIKYSRS
ncbi:hypothetical protein LXM63_04270 [Chryseobacterium gleum]|uniref:hypothetical protein n=1 Tax=Chryseobacterium gleum TaxID=250 RepID=UPI001E5EA469|nr:hypothetical protein [Chryseobacterium gleum]MCE4064297.1 hypothetical protein [Chryseobacterium gleum]